MLGDDKITKKANNSPDLLGHRFGKLVVTQRLGTTQRGRNWLCECDCGQKTIYATSELNQGRVKSCGCLRIAAKAKYLERAKLLWRDLNYRKKDYK